MKKIKNYNYYNISVTKLLLIYIYTYVCIWTTRLVRGTKTAFRLSVDFRFPLMTFLDCVFLVRLLLQFFVADFIWSAFAGLSRVTFRQASQSIVRLRLFGLDKYSVTDAYQDEEQRPQQEQHDWYDGHQGSRRKLLMTCCASRDSAIKHVMYISL